MVRPLVSIRRSWAWKMASRASGRSQTIRSHWSLVRVAAYTADGGLSPNGVMGSRRRTTTVTAWRPGATARASRIVARRLEDTQAR